MNSKSLIFTALLFIISIGNYITVISDGNIRAVEFASIFAIGALGGVLLTQIFYVLKSRKKM